MLRLTKHWSDRIDNPEAYVRAALVNLARDRARRNHLVSVPIEDSGIADNESRDYAGARAARERLDRLLGSLPPRQRITVVLRVVEGYSEKETSVLMWCAPGTVKSNLARGLDKLRDRISICDTIEEIQS